MARIIIASPTAPAEIKVGGESKWICMCGLSKNKPFCDGSHKQCAGETDGKIYKYDNGVRTETRI